MEILNTTLMAAPRVGPDPDEIEQRIIRAYVQLACRPVERGGARSLTVLRLGDLYVRLTEVPPEIPGMPLFWLEVYSDGSLSVIDSYGFSDLDEDELATAVELITGGGLRAHDRRH